MLELNYEMLARDVVGELAIRGSLKDLSRQALRGLLNEYRGRLRDVMQRRLYTELNRFGQLGPYLRLLRSDTAEAGAAYVQRAIPAYQLFLRQAVAQAKQEVIDNWKNGGPKGADV
jgi:hypothetical protein